ncbi:MarR family winged helix-turn-helix transcriptional regulator [Amnibacterium flavum]|uniref:MarR family transcriptional regulator n=1 Tax=Amnibacterium flavum TaxID=2173173 RepID=A0A2V1HXF8_9MICO|nr:MarR family transcriptional regulator [Amnibacterium flavum]PVZ95327.1 MarR family transcriptional regulator [Amnibacterium flavum]
MGRPHDDDASGYWYSDAEAASPVELLNLLRRYRAAEVAMRARTRASMKMNETDLLAIRYLLREARAGRHVKNRDLAERLNISSASVTVMLDRLERSGHIERRPHPTDRRAIVVVATTDSDREVRETLGEMHQRMLHLVEDMTDGERLTVARFLAGMTAAVEEAKDLDAELREIVRDSRA